MLEDFLRKLPGRDALKPDRVAERISRRSFTFGVGTAAAVAAVYAGARYGARTDAAEAPARYAPNVVATPMAGRVVATSTPRPTEVPGNVAFAAPATTVPTATATEPAQTDAEAGPDGSATPASTPLASGNGRGSGFGRRGGYGDPGTPLPLVGYPGAKWIPSPYHRPRTQAINTLVMHTTAGTLQSAINEFQHSTRHVSAHYIVGRDGEIIQMVSENQVAFHAGVVTAGPDSRFYGTNPNAYSIGIEMENLDVITSLADFPLAQRNAVFKLARDVVQRNHIPLDRQHIVGHSEIDPADRRDPGPGFPWSDFMAYLEG